MPEAKKMTISDVADALEISVMRVRQLDADLRPVRVGRIQMRLYDPSVVARVKKERAKSKRSA